MSEFPYTDLTQAPVPPVDKRKLVARALENIAEGYGVEEVIKGCVHWSYRQGFHDGGLAEAIVQLREGTR